jgi:hypothetical protein
MLRQAATQNCKFEMQKFHICRASSTFLGGIAMKKTSVKRISLLQLLINAMEETQKEYDSL